MKKLILIIFAIVISFPSFSQSQKRINKALSILDTFWQDGNIEKLQEAEILVNKIFENEEAQAESKAHFAKAQLMTAKIMQEDFIPEDVDAYMKEFTTAYKLAFIKDSRSTIRYFILEKLYSAKSKLGELGAQRYLEGDYEEALSYYNSATYLNELEIEYPRTVRPDTSTIYTTAVIAELAKDNKRAIELFQRLVDMEYNRSDVYDYLIRLYERDEFSVKAKKVRILKNKRFSELKQ